MVIIEQMNRDHQSVEKLVSDPSVSHHLWIEKRPIFSDHLLCARHDANHLTQECHVVLVTALEIAP